MGQSPLTNSGLDLGYRQLYNLDFAAAHATFRGWMAAHPADPLGPASDAAVYLFAEMHRLHILQAQFFVHDADFLAGPKGVTDPGFVRDLSQADGLAVRAVAASPNDKDALYVEALCHGLRADDMALIHKRNFAALHEMKLGTAAAQHLLALDPTYGDAYLALGVENYILGLKPAPERWLLRLDGAQTDKDAGLGQLRRTAATGHYLRPYAQILLAIAALRAQQPAVARGLLQQLAAAFPRNPLYAEELRRLGASR